MRSFARVAFVVAATLWSVVGVAQGRDAESGKASKASKAKASTPARASDVVVTINAAVLRRHPTAARVSAIIRELPEWKASKAGKGIDPIQGADAIVVQGSSSGRASVALAAQATSKDALEVHATNPSLRRALRALHVESAVESLDARLVPRADDGMDLHVTGRCADEAAASEAATSLTEQLRRANSFGVRIATRGVLNGAAFAHQGKTVRLDLAISPDQLSALLRLLEASVGVPPPSAAAGGGAPAAR